MTISLSYSEGETLVHSGWVAKICVKCHCIRAFSIHEIVEKTSLRVSLIPIVNSSRRTNSCLAQCDFCGLVVRQKPKVKSTTWRPSQDLTLLISETFPEATAEQAPNTNMNGVIAVLSQQIQTLKRELTGLRQGLRILATIYIIFVLISVSYFLTPPSKFTSEVTLLLVSASCLLLPAPLSYGIFRLISGFRYRRRYDSIITQRLRYLQENYRVSAGELDQVKDELSRIR